MMTDTNRPAITIVGHVCIDHNTVDGMYNETWGSAAIYIAEYYKNVLELEPNVITSYGTDLSAYFDTTTLANDPSLAKTLIYQNVIRSGMRTQSVINADTAVPYPLDDRIRSVIAQTDILIFAPLLPNYPPQYVRELCKLLPDTATTALLPQGYYREVSQDGHIVQRPFTESADVLPYIDILIQSDEDSPNAIDEVKKWTSSHTNLTAIVTMNSHGAVVIQEGSEQTLTTDPVTIDNIRSPVGAGDVFSAELLVSLHRGHTIIDAANDAQRAASRHIRGIR